MTETVAIGQSVNYHVGYLGTSGLEVIIDLKNSGWENGGEWQRYIELLAFILYSHAYKFKFKDGWANVALQQQYEYEGYGNLSCELYAHYLKSVFHDELYNSWKGVGEYRLLITPDTIEVSKRD